MHIRQYTASDAPAYVANCRERVCAEIGVEAGSPATKLLEHSSCFLLYDVTGQPYAMGEALFLDQTYPSLAASPYAALAAELPQDIARISGMRSTFVEPERRGNGEAFMLICLAAASVFRDRGAQCAMVTTAETRLDLIRLYRRMGARLAGRADFPNSPPNAVLVFDLDQLLAHPLAARATALLQAALV